MDNIEIIIPSENHDELSINANEISKYFKYLFYFKIIFNIIDIIRNIVKWEPKFDILPLLGTFVTIYLFYCISKYIKIYKEIIVAWIATSVFGYVTSYFNDGSIGTLLITLIASGCSIYVTLKYLKINISISSRLSEELTTKWQNVYTVTKYGYYTILICTALVAIATNEIAFVLLMGALVGSIIVLVGSVMEMFAYKTTADVFEALSQNNTDNL